MQSAIASESGVLTHLALYLRHLEARNLSPYTLRNYRGDVEGLLSYLSERGIDPMALDRSTWRDYLTTLKDQGLARASLSRKVSTVRLFYKWLVMENHIAVNPLRGVNSLPKIDHRLPDVLTESEVETLLEAPDSSTPGGVRDRAMLELLYATGIRLGEIHRLNLDDVKLSSRVLRVTGKGNKEREVIFGTPAATALEDYFPARRLMAQYEEPALFVNRDGIRISRRSIEKAVSKYGERAMGKRVHVHTLRHSFATHLLNGGADLRIVQHLLGHADPSTTALYLHVSSADLLSAYNRAFFNQVRQRARENGDEPDELRQLRYFLEDTQ